MTLSIEQIREIEHAVSTPGDVRITSRDAISLCATARRYIDLVEKAHEVASGAYDAGKLAGLADAENTLKAVILAIGGTVFITDGHLRDARSRSLIVEPKPEDNLRVMKVR